MRTIDVVLFGNLIQAIDPTLATSRVSAEGAKDLEMLAKASYVSQESTCFVCRRLNFNLHNVCAGKWLVT